MPWPRRVQWTAEANLQGTPFGCVTTAEICDWIRQDPIIANSVEAHFKNRNPKAIDSLREAYSELTWADAQGRLHEPEVSYECARRDMAITDYVFQAVKNGQLQLLYRENGSSERLRFDPKLFDDDFGPSDIASGSPPMFDAPQFEGVSLFLPESEALRWLQSIPRMPQNFSLPSGFVAMEYLVNRLKKYCAVKGDIAGGVVRPGTDRFGNWTNSGDEVSGRLQAQTYRHILTAAKSGAINIHYWRCDNNYLYSIPSSEWRTRNESDSSFNKDCNAFLIRMKMPPDLNRLQQDGILPADFSAELIVPREEAETFLDKHAPRREVDRLEVDRPKGGAPTKYDWNACFAFLNGKFEHHGELMDGDPEWSRQAHVVSAAADFFATNGQTPSETQLKKRVRQYLATRRAITS